MKSHKAGISSLPVASPALRAAGWVSQPCLFSRPHTKWAPLQRNRAFCACADIYWNLLLKHLPVKPQKSNWIFTQHCRSLYITPNPWVYVLRGNLGSHSWTAALRWWTEGISGIKPTPGERELGMKPWIRPRLEMLRKHFWPGLKVCWRDVVREQTRVKRVFWVWEAGGGDIVL